MARSPVNVLSNIPYPARLRATLGGRPAVTRHTVVAAGILSLASSVGTPVASGQSLPGTPFSSELQAPPGPIPSTPPTSYGATPQIAGCPGYSQCPIVNFQDVITYDPDARAANIFITRTEAKTLDQILTGHYPPGLDAKSILGEVMLYDRHLSVNGTVACATCHLPQEGFTSGVSLFNLTTVANPGAIGDRISARKPMSYGYAPLAPVLFYRPSTKDFVGGNFWDGRATGYVTGNPAADQALGPPLNPVEMANPDPACVVYSISQAQYRGLFLSVWGPQSFNIAWPSDTQKLCTRPGPTPSGTVLNLSTSDRNQVNATFDDFGLSIAAYEAGVQVSPFTSKFDYYLKGKASLTPTEMQGYRLFTGKGNCDVCHAASGDKPLFTDFTFINEGIPKNLQLPFYYENRPDNYGYVANPLGPSYVDDGLGAFLAGTSNPNPVWRQYADAFMGTFQTATVRNVGKKPRSSFVKAFMHNGYFQDLKIVVHWYNTAGVLPTCPPALGTAVGGPIGKTCWPAPEVPQNVNRTEMGDLGLTPEQEDAIVSFMLTLTDGYKPI